MVGANQFFIYSEKMYSVHIIYPNLSTLSDNATPLQMKLLDSQFSLLQDVVSDEPFVFLLTNYFSAMTEI
jgi:hypothetical protein